MIENGEIDEIETVIDNKNETNKHLKPILQIYPIFNMFYLNCNEKI